MGDSGILSISPRIKIKQEVVADLVGDYLFTDPDFINHLSTSNRNLFQKLYDEIKYLCKIATVGSKEARQLEKVKKAFEDAYRANSKAGAKKNTAAKDGIKYSLVSIDGKYYEPNYETLVKNHPYVTVSVVKDAKYQKGLRLSDAEYKEYRNRQVANAVDKEGFYTNKDTSYSDKYGELRAEFGTKAIKKGKSYGGIALYDILPHIGEIFENAVVVKTKPDVDNDTNIRGVVDLVGGAILGNQNLAVVKLNVIEYANDEAKIYDNRVIEIEELTVVGGVGQQSDSTSPAVSSDYILSVYNDFVNTNSENSRKNSLSPEGAKAEPFGRYNGEDMIAPIAMQNDIAPIGPVRETAKATPTENIAPLPETAQTSQLTIEDIAPIPENLNAQSTENQKNSALREVGSICIILYDRVKRILGKDLYTFLKLLPFGYRECFYICFYNL